MRIKWPRVINLPIQKSTSVSTSPLELFFSDLWGPTSESFGCFKYYMSFIDDYSKFMWIYLLKKKSDVRIENSGQRIRQAQLGFLTKWCTPLLPVRSLCRPSPETL
jgi:hypothetical protein